MTYPNLTIELGDGTKVLIRNLYPELRYCYYNFKDYQDDKTGSMNIDVLDIVLDKDALL